MESQTDDVQNGKRSPDKPKATLQEIPVTQKRSGSTNSGLPAKAMNKLSPKKKGLVKKKKESADPSGADATDQPLSRQTSEELSFDSLQPDCVELAPMPSLHTCYEDEPVPSSIGQAEDPATASGRFSKQKTFSAIGVGEDKRRRKTCFQLAKSFVNKRREMVLSLVDDHRSTLEATSPEVALIIPVPDASSEDIEMLAAPNFANTLPDCLKLVASAHLRFHGAPGKLWVLELDEAAWQGIGLDSGSEASTDGGKPPSASGSDPPSPQPVRMTPAEELQAIFTVLEKWQGSTLEDTVPWPLHEPKVSEALLSQELEILALADGFCGSISRILHALRVFSPDEDGPFMESYRAQYGKAASFASVWMFFFAQGLWLMVPFVVVILILGIRPAANGDDRVKFEFVKAGVIIWGIIIASLCSSRFLGDGAVEVLQRKRQGKARKSTKNEDYLPNGIGMKSFKARWVILFSAALPALLILAGFCMAALIMTTNLILHIIYVWGDCYNLHTPEKICRDAEQKHGALGWAAEVSCDIALAILFELFFAISQALADWISTLLNFEYETDRTYFKSMLEVSLSMLERIGFVGSLAFLFAPQWEVPHGKGNVIDVTQDCSTYMFGNSSYQCFQRRLPVELRRSLVEKLMKGPFVVAPFIAILIKTIIPYVIHRLQMACDYCLRFPLACLPFFPARFVVRFFTLIFSLDGDNVGCCKFTCHGWPFSDVSVDICPQKSGKEPLSEYKKGIFSILDQAVLKPFSPEDELMELKMSFLWVLFFTPLMPLGVITTLIAKILEINFDMVKMLIVRRRSFPSDCKVMRRSVSSFVNAVVMASFGWTIGLSLVTYNDDLYKWKNSGRAVLACMCLWLFFCAVLGFSKRTGMLCAFGYGFSVQYYERFRKTVLMDKE